MKFWTLGCDCGCPDPLLRYDEEGNESIAVFRTKEAAELEASSLDPKAKVIECEVEPV